MLEINDNGIVIYYRVTTAQASIVICAMCTHICVVSATARAPPSPSR